MPQQFLKHHMAGTGRFFRHFQFRALSLSRVEGHWPHAVILSKILERRLHATTRLLCIRIRPYGVQLWLVEPGLSCRKLCARHPRIELQPNLVTLVVDIASCVQFAPSLVCTDILLAAQTGALLPPLHSTSAEDGKAWCSPGRKGGGT
jgi:hypothetical protein